MSDTAALYSVPLLRMGALPETTVWPSASAPVHGVNVPLRNALPLRKTLHAPAALCVSTRWLDALYAIVLVDVTAAPPSGVTTIVLGYEFEFTL